MATTQIETHKNFIGGQWQESVSGRTYQVYNPARKTESVGEFQTSNLEDTAAAVAAAKEAAAGWANTPAPVRASVLFKALEILGRRGDEIARTITTEEGKPIADALGEVKRAMNIIEYAAGEGRRMFGYTTPSELPNTVAYTMKRPLGVVAIITPWNFPIAIPAWKMAPALISGNALIFKPASATPLSAVKLVEVFEEAGIPPGVLNLITGPGGPGGQRLGGAPRCRRHILHRLHRDRHRPVRHRSQEAEESASRDGRQERRHPSGRRRHGEGFGRDRSRRFRLHTGSGAPPPAGSSSKRRSTTSL